MKRFLNKKVAAVGLAAGIILGGAGAAFAYFSGNGSGSGSASTGSVGTDLAISQTNTVTGLLPAGPAQTIDLTITNNGSGSEKVGTVTGTVTAVSSRRAFERGVQHDVLHGRSGRRERRPRSRCQQERHHDRVDG